MAATGNEVARLEQLKGIFPQVVSYISGSSASITLGNGKVVTFSGTSGRGSVYLLVKVMYNCFELIQAISNINGNTTVSVDCDDGMNTFKNKFVRQGVGQESHISYVAENGTIYAAPIDGNAKTFNFGVIDGNSTFIGALIYVD